MVLFGEEERFIVNRLNTPGPGSFENVRKALDPEYIKAIYRKDFEDCTDEHSRSIYINYKIGNLNLLVI